MLDNHLADHANKQQIATAIATNTMDSLLQYYQLQHFIPKIDTEGKRTSTNSFLKQNSC